MILEQSPSLYSFRSNTRYYFDAAIQTPIQITRNREVFILMSKEHYIDLINKIKAPHLMQMPATVHTLVHFQTITKQSS